MENKKLMIMFAAGFSIIFSFMYYGIFLAIGSVDVRILYMNQIGLYEKVESVLETQEKLKKEGITTYTLKQDDLTAVVCDVSVDEADIKAGQKILKEKSYSYIEKSVTIDNVEIIKLIDEKAYEKVLERIGK